MVIFSFPVFPWKMVIFHTAVSLEGGLIAFPIFLWAQLHNTFRFDLEVEEITHHIVTMCLSHLQRFSNGSPMVAFGVGWAHPVGKQTKDDIQYSHSHSHSMSPGTLFQQDFSLTLLGSMKMSTGWRPSASTVQQLFKMKDFVYLLYDPWAYGWATYIYTLDLRVGLNPGFCSYSSVVHVPLSVISFLLLRRACSVERDLCPSRGLV